MAARFHCIGNGVNLDLPLEKQITTNENTNRYSRSFGHRTPDYTTAARRYVTSAGAKLAGATSTPRLLDISIEKLELDLRLQLLRALLQLNNDAAIEPVKYTNPYTGAPLTVAEKQLCYTLKNTICINTAN